MSGDVTVGITTFSRMPFHLICALEVAVPTAPTSPPMRAWEELEGIAKYQVTKFQVTAAIKAARTTDWVTAPGSTMPLPRVAATSVEMSAPNTFATAAIARATVGLSARVEMDVAIAFAESWKPFVKSKRSAVAMTMKSRLALKEPPRRASGARRMPHPGPERYGGSTAPAPVPGLQEDRCDGASGEREERAGANQADGLEDAH